ncbi:MAG: hypothetical protein FWH01_15235 [Oscillospiraceae bacterium]|nr:hypothetical protein [Oscillospiraceae bacterium]
MEKNATLNIRINSELKKSAEVVLISDKANADMAPFVKEKFPDIWEEARRINNELNN